MKPKKNIQLITTALTGKEPRSMVSEQVRQPGRSGKHPAPFIISGITNDVKDKKDYGLMESQEINVRN